MSQNVVVMGGGTGIFPVTQALKHLEADVSTIIAVSDSGGSSGRIRDEFGFQPVGDLRQSLAALAENDGQAWIRRLLLYRFEKGNGLKGHNLGNLILTALQDLTGDTSEALEIATQIFRLSGTVIPATKEIVDLAITYEDGSQQIGEDYLNAESGMDKKVANVTLQPDAILHPKATEAILNADSVIIGPGDLYASLLATLLPNDVPSVFANSNAQIIYVVNLMTRHLQTDNMTARDHVQAIEDQLQKKIDMIIINNQPIPEPVLAIYQKANEHPVEDDLTDDSRVVRADILAEEAATSAKSDALHRSYLRHDPMKLLSVFKELIK